MSASAEIIDKIKKLLRLSRSANPHEAALALQRALALAREHGVAVDSLNPDEQMKEKTVIHRETDGRQRMSYDKEYAVRIIQAFFHVTPVFNQRIVRPLGGRAYIEKFVTVVGTAADVEIALYVYGFLVHHFAFCWRKYRGRLRNRHAYVDGMFDGLYRKLFDAQPQPTERETKGNELVLAEHKCYIAAVIGKTSSIKLREADHDAHAARLAGWLKGQDTHIAPALRPSEEPAPLALHG